VYASVCELLSKTGAQDSGCSDDHDCGVWL
jgi:hypothetical protein